LTQTVWLGIMQTLAEFAWGKGRDHESRSAVLFVRVDAG